MIGILHQLVSNIQRDNLKFIESQQGISKKKNSERDSPKTDPGLALLIFFMIGILHRIVSDIQRDNLKFIESQQGISKMPVSM